MTASLLADAIAQLDDNGFVDVKPYVALAHELDAPALRSIQRCLLIDGRRSGILDKSVNELPWSLLMTDRDLQICALLTLSARCGPPSGAEKARRL